MHIAYLIPSVDRIGGAERQTLLLANGMAQRGWRVSLIALSGAGMDAAKTLAENNIAFQSLGMRKGLLDPRGWIRFHRWIHSHKPDVLHANLPHAALFARWSRAFATVPVLIDTIHSPHTGGFTRRAGHKLSSRIPDVVTAVSSAAAAPWLNARLVDRDRLVIVPNGVDINYWSPVSEHAKLQLDSVIPRRFTWLAVGRLDPVKDYATLLNAIARLPHHAELVIAGSGPDVHRLQSLAHALDIAHRVAFVGFQENLLPIMHQSHAFVLPSRWEGLPVALMEASACALPAVITNTPGSREVLLQGSTLAVPVGDPNALAVAMNALMKLSPPERREIGLRARDIVVERFSLNAMLNRYDVLYHDALIVSRQPARFRHLASGSSAPVRSVIQPLPRFPDK